MPITQLSRRRFVAESSRATTGGWIALQLPWLAALASCARDDARTGRAFTSLTPNEARTMRAFAAQIIPSTDGTPGAEEAGAVYFVDRALGMPFFADIVPVIRAGLADLDAHARVLGGKGDFASTPGALQFTILQHIENREFFAAARMLVVTGTFADPEYGGNIGGAGWNMIGIDHRPSYSAPFGWYDASLGAEPPTGP